MKLCKRCGNPKSCDDFPIDKGKKDGYYSYCKLCKAEKESIRNKNKTILKHQQMIASGKRLCVSCKQIKTKEEFGGLFECHGAVSCVVCKKEWQEQAKINRRIPKHLQKVRVKVSEEDQRRRKNDNSKRIYAENKEKIKRHYVILRLVNKTVIIKKLGNACFICGEEVGKRYSIACFDLHHNEENKEGNVAKLLNLSPWKYGNFDKIWAEAQKCKPICAMCHRKEHNV